MEILIAEGLKLLAAKLAECLQESDEGTYSGLLRRIGKRQRKKQCFDCAREAGARGLDAFKVGLKIYKASKAGDGVIEDFCHDMQDVPAGFDGAADVATAYAKAILGS